MVKVRGQNYPAISLAEAISKIEIIYKQERDRAVEKATIAKALGCSVTGKAFTSTIAALMKYGLLKSVEPALLKVSENAENIILLSRGHPDRVMSLRNIAFTPYLFSKIRENLGEGLPNNDTICASLIEMGFGTRTLENVVYSYLETLKFIQEEETFVLSDQKTNDQLSEELVLTLSNENAKSSFPKNTNVIHAALSTSPGTTLQYQIAVDCTARIEFDGQVTQEGLEKLIALLELNADVFPIKSK